MRLVLVVPGLASVLAQPELAQLIPSAAHLLADGRAATVPAQPLETFIHSLTSTALQATALPLAALQAATIGLPAATGRWLRADWVHLQLDQRGAKLWESSELAVPATELRELYAASAPCFQAAGATLYELGPTCALLHWPDTAADNPSFAAPSGLPSLRQVRGQPVQEFLLQGDKLTRQLFSELQISVHQVPSQMARAAAGLPTLNAVWLWGGGHCPVEAGLLAAAGEKRLLSIPPPSVLWTDLTWVTACMQCHRVRSVGAGYTQAAGDGLAVLDALEAPWAYGDYAGLEAVLSAYERQWFKPVLQALRQGQLTQLTLHPLAGVAYSLPVGWWRIKVRLSMKGYGRSYPFMRWFCKEE